MFRNCCKVVLSHEQISLPAVFMHRLCCTPRLQLRPCSTRQVQPRHKATYKLHMDSAVLLSSPKAASQAQVDSPLSFILAGETLDGPAASSWLFVTNDQHNYALVAAVEPQAAPLERALFKQTRPRQSVGQVFARALWLIQRGSCCYDDLTVQLCPC